MSYTLRLPQPAVSKASSCEKPDCVQAIRIGVIPDAQLTGQQAADKVDLLHQIVGVARRFSAAITALF